LGVEPRKLTATFAFVTPDGAHLFVGKATHAFQVGCFRRGLRVTMEIQEERYESLVTLAKQLGGEALVV
jgi:hypothetical protein